MLLLIRWLSRRRLSTLHAWGALLGWLAFGVSRTYRQRMRANADAAGLTGAERRQAVAQAGRMVAELPWLWLRPPGQPMEIVLRLVDAAHVRLGPVRRHIFIRVQAAFQRRNPDPHMLFE